MQILGKDFNSFQNITTATPHKLRELSEKEFEYLCAFEQYAELKDDKFSAIACQAIEEALSHHGINLNSNTIREGATYWVTEPIPDHGDHMELQKFFNDVKCGLLLDCQGYGQLATQDKMSIQEILPSEVYRYDFPEWVTHIVWFNR